MSGIEKGIWMSLGRKIAEGRKRKMTEGGKGNIAEEGKRRR